MLCCGRYIESGLANYVRLDICNVGGFTEAMKVAGWAEARCTPPPPSLQLVCRGLGQAQAERCVPCLSRQTWT
eukprot:COSAG04_NODE_393_length_15147_cov_44.965643_11_plen_73_part_00